ncbi:MAG: hypothetical protein ACREXT_14805, partial [Gammaproteobacteria bacterium]
MAPILPDTVDIDRLAGTGARLTGTVPAARLQRMNGLYRIIDALAVDLAFSFNERHVPYITGAVYG